MNPLLVEKVRPATHPGDAPTAHTLALPLEARRKSRQRALLPGGVEIALLLPAGTVLRHGDRLEAVDGTLIRVEAAPEPVLHVTAGDGLALARAAYHLGNRHVPVQLGHGFLRLAPDAVLEGMLGQLGVVVEGREEPFEPEWGAYGGGHRHGHDETFAEDHALARHLYEAHEPGVRTPESVHRHPPPEAAARPSDDPH